MILESFSKTNVGGAGTNGGADECGGTAYVDGWGGGTGGGKGAGVGAVVGGGVG